MTVSREVARQMWTCYEAVHAVTYFTPEAREALEAAGLRGFWRGYFAARAAPLGPVDAAPVTALFFNFAPSMVGRALPDVWSRAAPQEVLQARRAGAAAALRRLVEGASAGSGSTESAVEEAAVLAELAVAHADTAGRALAAANAALPAANAALPAGEAEPLARLWQAATTLREHRGDGHVAALVAAGLTGCQVLVLRSALDGYPEVYQQHRGWTDEQWAAARDELIGRGWLDPAGQPTATGRDGYQAVEETTDKIAAGPWRGLGSERTDRLAALLLPIAYAVSTALPYPNPVGLPPLPPR
jgi:hypothetical protein